MMEILEIPLKDITEVRKVKMIGKEWKNFVKTFMSTDVIIDWSPAGMYGFTTPALGGQVTPVLATQIPGGWKIIDGAFRYWALKEIGAETIYVCIPNIDTVPVPVPVPDGWRTDFNLIPTGEQVLILLPDGGKSVVELVDGRLWSASACANVRRNVKLVAWKEI